MRKDVSCALLVDIQIVANRRESMPALGFRKTYCKNGHPLKDAYITEHKVSVKRDGSRKKKYPLRICRQCQKKRMEKY